MVRRYLLNRHMKEHSKNKSSVDVKLYKFDLTAKCFKL